MFKDESGRLSSVPSIKTLRNIISKTASEEARG
jgi:hypothetical protein